VLNPEPCRCGRTIVRMGRIQGRSDDMLIIRGVNVFPSQIESVIMETKHFEPHYQLVVERIGTLDQLTVLVEVNEAMFSDEIKNLQSIERELERNIRETLGVATQVKLVEPKGIQRSEGKALR
jgi:phenylacetate-CoA ligase